MLGTALGGEGGSVQRPFRDASATAVGKGLGDCGRRALGGINRLAAGAPLDAPWGASWSMAQCTEPGPATQQQQEIR